MDSNQDNRALTRADSNHSVNSTISQDSRDHKIPRSSKHQSNVYATNGLNVQYAILWNCFWGISVLRFCGITEQFMFPRTHTCTYM